jgi:phenylpropionate dioxygenase-like ring-hydroxylating dioxygenase large terminal subunit
MNLAFSHANLLRSLIGQLDGVPAKMREVGEVPVEHYVSTDHFELERRSIFARFPQVVAVERELPAPGSRCAADVAGVSLLVVRGQDGVLRAFKNACRHRSTRLVEDGPPCISKAIVCPYHGWTYDLSGCRLHAPHAEAFQGKDATREGLVPAFAGAREGFVWAGLETFELDPFLEPIASDLAALGASSWHPYRRVEHDVRANWKLFIDAFLDGYHIRHLHRDTLYRFFLDACFDAEEAGHHIRSLVARRALVEARHGAIADLTSVATPSYFLFPNTILILHPDYLSVTVAMPVAASRTRFVHTMLIPEAPRTDRDAAHWQKSFELIDRNVFAAEDLYVIEAMQRGMETGANRSQLFGEQEFPALWFHRRLRAIMA